MGRKEWSKPAWCVLPGGHRLLFLILDPKALPEPNRRDADKECCVLFLIQPDNAEARQSDAQNFLKSAWLIIIVNFVEQKQVLFHL